MTGASQDPGDPVGRVRAYYRALDGDEYDLLRSVLVPEFVQHRPDTTLDGRGRFVEFMREERPVSDTTHVLDGLYTDCRTSLRDRSSTVGRSDRKGLRQSVYRPAAASDSPGEVDPGVPEVVARGRLLGSDGAELTRFVDVFAVTEAGIAELRTYVG